MDGRRMHPKLVMVALSVAVAVAVAVHVVFGDNDFLSRNHFPPSFVFGSASSAYQVHTMELANGDVDCDAYHKYKEDVQSGSASDNWLMESML